VIGASRAQNCAMASAGKTDRERRAPRARSQNRYRAHF
jgi:hypothetical protein